VLTIGATLFFNLLAVALKNAEMRFNFGSAPFKHNPGDYKPMCEAPVAETTLGAAGSVSRQGYVNTLSARCRG
jgi:hypothetical protein